MRMTLHYACLFLLPPLIVLQVWHLHTGNYILLAVDSMFMAVLVLCILVLSIGPDDGG